MSDTNQAIRCGTCRWWGPTVADYGECRQGDVGDTVLIAKCAPFYAMATAISTRADFGCVLWEPEERA